MELDEYTEKLRKTVKKHGGFINFHTHLDRAGTLDRQYLEHVGMNPIEASSYPLEVKRNLVGDLHRGVAYTKESLEERIRKQLELMIIFDTREVVSFIDTTADEVGLRALEVALRLKEEYKDRINLKLAAYPIFGFKVDEPKRWEIYVEAAKEADILGGIPERDDKKEHPRSVGYDEHIKRILILGRELRKEVHIHVDQGNREDENGTETLVEAVRWLGQPIEREEPSVWAIHSISPSCYDEKRFRSLVDKLLKYNVGVICCPSAALSMRQPRPLKSYTHNSIARILEMLERGVKVRIGSDNIADVFVPSGTPNLYKEFYLLTNAIRFYHYDILVKIGCGVDLTDMDRHLIHQVLEQDRAAWREIESNS